MDKNISPVGWYVASYIIRFVVVDDDRNNDPERKFLAWENTILINAASMEDAYEKVVIHVQEESLPYKGGESGADVKWEFEGVTELLPVYEEIKDGAEIMFRHHNPKKLKNIRNLVRTKDQLLQT
jgi:hypothetical protein